jgi:hypothetical protein
MNQKQWQKAYEPVPQQLEYRVSHTLKQLEAVTRRPGRKLRLSVIIAALLIALCGVAYAMIHSQVADIFGWFYGEDKKTELLAGDIAPSGQSVQLGDVVYRLDEVVYSDGSIYGTGTMLPAGGANVVLIPEDYGVHDRAGYILHYGDEIIPDDAPTYAELARERGAKILLAKCVADGVINPDGTLNASEIGYTQLPQPDGSIRFTFEFTGGEIDNGRMSASTIDRASSYTVSLHIANWEVTPDGLWLREEPDDTWLKQEWAVTVTPIAKGE